MAYAPDEILLTLSLAGLVAYAYSWKIAILVAVVMLVVVASYRQNVHAYPSGGGDYEVATVNLGPTAGTDRGQRAAGRLRADRGGLDLLRRAEREVGAAVHRRPRGLGRPPVAVLILMALNLRGRTRVRHRCSPSRPTASWSGIIGMVVCGLFRILVLGDEVQAAQRPVRDRGRPESYAAFTGFAMVALLARAFSSGCAALTGVEAISNGVPAFKKPKSKNAATTLLLLGTISVTMLIGVVTLANLTGLKLIDARSLALHAERAAGRRSSRRPRSASWPGRSSPASRRASTSSSRPP